MKPSDFMDLVFNGKESEGAFSDLLESNKEEGLDLDFKSGKILQKKGAAHDVRSDVAAFANSAGGLLVLGVLEPERKKIDPYTLDGCEDVGKQTAYEWAGRAYQPLAPYLYPPPKTVAIEMDGKVIIAIAVPRSERLVPCVKEGKLTYFLRIGESTVGARARSE